MYAVTVREGNENFLFWRITRNPRREVFVMFPRGQVGWDPHASYHADGRCHQKSFNCKSIVRQGPKLDDHFVGTFNVVSTGIARDEPRAINRVCNLDEFVDILEILGDELALEKYRTYVGVDLTNGTDLIPHGRVLRQKIFKDTVPWIMVTFYSS